MLVLAPVMCILGGIGASACLEVYMGNVKASEAAQAGSASSGVQGLFGRLYTAIVGGQQAGADEEAAKEKESNKAGAGAGGSNKQKQKKQKRSEMLYPYKGEVCTCTCTCTCSSIALFINSEIL